MNIYLYIQSAFTRHDANADGGLDVEETAAALKDLGIYSTRQEL